MKIVFASGNRGKFKEMASHLAPVGAELLFGGDLQGPREIEESGDAYEENALIKARAWAQATGLPALADDSGLEVSALAGLPGIRSSRIVQGTDAARTQWLLRELSDKEDRRARFVCAIVVLLSQDEEPLVARGCCGGTIARSPRGASGFGYDPLFIPDGYDKTFAELGDEIKNKISHRAIAAQNIAEILKAVIK